MADSAPIDLGLGRARDSTSLRGDRRFLVALLATSLCVLGLFVGFRHLPMVDLPQHAAQIQTWIHWGDPAYPNADIEINLRTPYLLAYFLAKALTPAVGVVFALKLVVFLAAVGNALALGALARKLGHDPWVGLLGLPTAFGYAFYFGFVSFLAAVPLGVLCLALAVDHAREPRFYRGAALSAVACLTLFAHGVACAIALSCALPLLLRGKGSLLARFAPLAAPVLLAIVWLGPGSSMSRMGSHVSGLGLYRLVNLPASLVSFDVRDHLGTALGLGLLGVLLFCLGEPSRSPVHWLPLGVVLAGFCFFPAAVNGYGFMAPRFAAFLVPATLIAVRPRSLALGASGVARLCRPLVASLTACWVVLFGVRLAVFNRDSATFDELIARMQPALRVRSIVFDASSAAFPGVPAFLHFAAYYMAEKGGVLGHSFTMYPNSVLRLRPGAHSLIAPGSEWAPETFDAHQEAPLFDYFLVRSAVDRSAALFGATPQIVLDARAGDWWGYRVERFEPLPRQPAE